MDLEPKHVVFGRDALGVSPTHACGMNVSATLKTARWRCDIEETWTEPEDDFHVVELKRSGGAIYRLDNKSPPIINRTVTLGPARSSALWVSDGIVEFSQLFLCTSALKEIANSIYGFSTAVNDDELMPEMEGIVDFELSNMVSYCEDLCCRNQYVGRLELDALGQLVGAYIVRNRSRLTGAKAKKRNTNISDSMLSQVLDCIEEHLTEDLSLAYLSSLTGLSSYHFCRVFKKLTGYSPHQYVLARRIARARELLSFSNDTLANIAYTSGFSSQAHMTDVFQKRIGITPGQYRKEFIN